MYVTPGNHAAIVWVTDMAEDDAEDIEGQRGSIWTLDHLLHMPQQPASNVKGGRSQVLVDKSFQQEVASWMVEQGWEARVRRELSCKRCKR